MSALITCSHVDFGYENHDAVVDLTMEVEEGDYFSSSDTTRVPLVGFKSPKSPFTRVLFPEPLTPTTQK